MHRALRTAIGVGFYAALTSQRGTAPTRRLEQPIQTTPCSLPWIVEAALTVGTIVGLGIAIGNWSDAE
jgi:hypothetical protein